MRSACKIVLTSVLSVCLSYNFFMTQATVDAEGYTHVITTGPQQSVRDTRYDTLPVVTTVPDSAISPENTSHTPSSDVTEAPLETTEVSFTSPRILASPATTTMPFFMNKPSQYYYGDIVYINKTSTAVIFGIPSDEEVLKIPSQINGKTVTTLGGGLFSIQKVKTLYLPDTINFINSDTFKELTKITDIYYQGSKEQWDEAMLTNRLPEGIEVHFDSQYDGYGLYKNIEYFSNGTEIEITGCRRDIKAADIPSEIDGLPVTKIGNCAFEGCQYLENVTIPDSVSEVGKYAFNACKALKNVYYKGSSQQWDKITWNDTQTVDDIKSILSFDGEPKHTEVTTVTELTEVPKNTSDTQIPDVTEAPLETTAVSFTMPRVLTAPKTTTMPMSPGKPSQYYYGEIVYLNKGTYDCIFGIISNEETVAIPSQINGKPVQILSSVLFADKKTKTLYLPDTLTFFNTDTFSDSKITDIFYQGTKAQWDAITYSDRLPEGIEVHFESQYNGYGVFNKNIEYYSNGKEIEITGCPRDIKAADIPSEINGLPVTKIGKCAFEGCQYLEDVTIPDSVREVGQYAFNACKALKNVYYTGSSDEWDKITWNDTLSTDSIKSVLHFDSKKIDDKDNFIGDMNGDKIVTASDVVILQRYLLCNDTPEIVNNKNADINNDGKINVLDLIMLKNMFFS